MKNGEHMNFLFMNLIEQAVNASSREARAAWRESPAM